MHDSNLAEWTTRRRGRRWRANGPSHRARTARRNNRSRPRDRERRNPRPRLPDSLSPSHWRRQPPGKSPGQHRSHPHTQTGRNRKPRRDRSGKIHPRPKRGMECDAGCLPPLSAAGMAAAAGAWRAMISERLEVIKRDGVIFRKITAFEMLGRARQPPRVNRRSSVNRLVNRQPVDEGERFASDCAIHISVSRFLEMSENRSKSAPVRAICDRAWTRRTPETAGIARIGQNLSGRDFARSMEIRRKFANLLQEGTLRRSVSRSVHVEHGLVTPRQFAPARIGWIKGRVVVSWAVHGRLPAPSLGASDAPDRRRVAGATFVRP